MWKGISKRKFPRANYPCKITIKRKDQAESISTHTENIGVGGICVILSNDLGIFAPVEINLDLLDGQPAINCDGAIVWIVKRKQDSSSSAYDTGIEFTTIARDDADRINDVVEKTLKEV
ncbi:MAG: PilZ domain-containing protein [Candidatus Omnitrophica bacterium]|nr:PilZ domain-containing protein [Candidatus Omnitrophota bacterium]